MVNQHQPMRPVLSGEVQTISNGVAHEIRVCFVGRQRVLHAGSGSH